MRLLTQTLAILGAVVLCALMLTIVTPKTAHAVVATLVEIANTSANPVAVTQGAELATEPFSTMICTDNTSGTLCGEFSKVAGAAPPPSFTVPSTDSSGNRVKALVIQFVSGSCEAVNMVLTTTVPANGVNGITEVVNPLNLVAQATVGSEASVPGLDQATTIVAGPGSTVGVVASFPSSGNGVCLVTVNGYLAH